MTLYIENAKESTSKVLKLIYQLSKVTGLQVQYTKINCISIHLKQTIQK